MRFSFWQRFFLDRYGNRNITATLGGVNGYNPTYNTNSNRIVGLSYDSAGNLTNDGAKVMAYDAENRMVSATGGNYVYDGEGKRVKRVASGQEWWSVYGLGGELVAEYLWTAPTTVQKEYGYRSGQMLIVGESGNVRWLVTDHLGSTRMTAEGSGSLTGMKRQDYLPFGEDLYVGLRRNGANGQYGYEPPASTVRQKFTGYERDVETGLDYAQARMYANIQGRFTSPDEFTGGPDELLDFADVASDNPTLYADLTAPQSLNKYQYTYNNPLVYTDPTGHCPRCIKTAVKTAAKSIKKGKVDLSDVYDAVDAVTTIVDSDASLVEKGLAVFDLVSPLSSKEIKAVDKFLDNTEFVKDAQKAIGKLHKNSNDAESHFILYEVADAGGTPLKRGIADAERTNSVGIPVRMRDSERKAQKQYPGATATQIQDLGRTTKRKGKEAEAAAVRQRRKEGHAMPLNREKDKRYQPGYDDK